MYSNADQLISKSSVAAAEEFAGYAAVAIANAALYHASADLTQQMKAAMESRAVIEQAKGILMGQQRCSADAAFALLTFASQNRNQKLRDVAAAIVASTENQETPQTPAG